MMSEEIVETGEDRIRARAREELRNELSDSLCRFKREDGTAESSLLGPDGRPYHISQLLQALRETLFDQNADIRERRAIEGARLADTPLPRFDGVEAWANLDPMIQAMIGALALELAAVWSTVDDLAETAGNAFGRDAVMSRAAEQAAGELATNLQATFKAIAGVSFAIPSSLGRVCVDCGCSENDPCPEGCAWATETLCTSCSYARQELPNTRSD